MSLKRIYVGHEVAHRLSVMKTRTGLTPNLSCRLGFCLSLAEAGVPQLGLYTTDEQVREFNRYTLTGEWDKFFFALLRERMVQDELDWQDTALLEEQFKAHLNRGVLLLYQRVKQIEDLGDLVVAAQKRMVKAASIET